MSFLNLASRPRRCLFKASRCFTTGSTLRTSRPLGAASKDAAANSDVSNRELEVGELEGASFRVEPIRRSGEDVATQRARLLYQSRKRGTLESDLLLSTFADVNLGKMNAAQLEQYDRFLDENDWDIYYWATQEPTPGAEEDEALSQSTLGKSPLDTAEWTRPQVQGEWAQTVGAFKPAYRPVPSRWKNSEILALLRKHVKDRSAGGVHESASEGQEAAANTGGTGGGLGMMPKIKHFDA